MSKAKNTYQALNPATGQVQSETTTRTGITYLVFSFNDYFDQWVATITTAATEDKALKAARSSRGAGYTGAYHVVPAELV